MLNVRHLSVGYKELLAIQDVSFTVKQGEVVSLVGSNGAGKSTILRTIAGCCAPGKGRLSSKASRSTSSRHMRSCGSASLWCRRQAAFRTAVVLDNLLLGRTL